jgi:PAS domain S-box-containing protein
MSQPKVRSTTQRRVEDAAQIRAGPAQGPGRWEHRFHPRPSVIREVRVVGSDLHRLTELPLCLDVPAARWETETDSTPQPPKHQNTYLHQMKHTLSAPPRARRASLRRVQREELYRALAQNLPSGAMALFDRDLRHLIAEGPGLAAMGLSKETVEGRTLWEVFPPETCALIEAPYRAALAGKVGSVEVPFADRLLLMQIAPVKRGRGKIQAGMVLAQDITEQRRQARLMEQSKSVAQVSGWEFDVLTRQLYWTERTYLLHETSIQEYQPALDTALAFYTPESAPLIEAAFERGLRFAEPWDIEVEIITARKNHLWVHMVGRVQQEGCRVVRLFGSFQNISARKRFEVAHAVLEVQLRQSQKMDSIGQLAGGVAHEFNNLLTIIRGQSELTLAYEPLTADGREWTKQVIVAVERAALLTRQLLTFSRKQPMQPAPLDLNVAVGNFTKLLGSIIGEHIELRLVCAASLLPVHADPHMIEQALMNLATNARDAMPHGGALTISTTALVVSPATARQHDARPGPYVRLSVTDTGTGITPENLPRIFEPFFTTKEVGKGTGLGLATVQGIVQQHEGWIEVQSEPGQGTTFHIHLPAASATTGGSADEPFQSFQSVTARILIVEDEGALRDLIRVVLTRLGHQVTEAASGVAALKQWDEHAGAFDLVVSDVVMPCGVSGWDLAEQLRARSPQLKIILISGYDPHQADQGASSGLGIQFLAKPFTPQALVQTVRKCLAAR